MPQYPILTAGVLDVYVGVASTITGSDDLVLLLCMQHEVTYMHLLLCVHDYNIIMHNYGYCTVTLFVV